MAPMISRVSPILGVPHVRKAAEYYRDVMGFDLDPVDGIFQPPGSRPAGVYAIVKLGDAWIHFQARPDPVFPRERASIERDVYLYVDRVEDFFEAVQGRGAKILQNPYDAPYGIREFVVEDLNGYRISFGQTM